MLLLLLDNRILCRRDVGSVFTLIVGYREIWKMELWRG